MSTKLDIHAITSSDLKSVLTDLDMVRPLEAGELLCPETGQIISWENIGMLRIENGLPVLYSIEAHNVTERYQEAS